MKPYQNIPIIENHEPLLPIPSEIFAFESPHPYEKLGATYGGRSPYFLRQGVLEALIVAQTHLQQSHPGWKIQIFDAYRPVEVQQFMVDYTFNQALQAQGLRREQLSPEQEQNLWEKVYELWAIPSLDSKMPPPHSTGAAIDVTLVNENGEVINMGSPIDELSARSHPDYYHQGSNPQEQTYHQHRVLLQRIMNQGNFLRHPGEWWHFSFRDQMWVWLKQQQSKEISSNNQVACYGRVLTLNPLEKESLS